MLRNCWLHVKLADFVKITDSSFNTRERVYKKLDGHGIR
jgi:hypothetical protein